jgi:hypothetical protein
MSVLFESILLFSLAVLIIIMGGLVYYFKKRIVEVEQNNATCLEVVQDVYMQHTKLRNEVSALMQMQYQYHQQTHHVKSNDELIKIVLSEDESEREDDDINNIDDSENENDNESESESDNESESDSDNENEDTHNHEVNQMKNEDKVKIVNVDMSFPEEFEIDIDEDLDGEYGGEEDSELKSLGQTDQVVVNKVNTTTPMSKRELKKLSPSVLKSLLIEKGIDSEQVAKMKKNELIDKLAVM